MRDRIAIPVREAGIKVPEEPTAIPCEPELRAPLRIVDAHRTYPSRREAAILRLFIDTGARRAEVTNLRWVPEESDTNDVDLDTGFVQGMGKDRRVRHLLEQVGHGAPTHRDVAPLPHRSTSDCT